MHRDRILTAVTTTLDALGREHLEALGFRPVRAESLDAELARLHDHVAPAFLPLASESDKTLAIHLWPGRDLDASPVVLIDDGARGAEHLCGRLAHLPGALWLWALTYYEDELDVLDAATSGMADGLPGARFPREQLRRWEADEGAVSRWQMDKPAACEAWALVDPGFPWAHLAIDEDRWERLPAEDALPELRARYEAGPRSPEELAQVLACGLLAGVAPDPGEVATVLGAEVFRDVRLWGHGPWRARGEGLVLWDALLARLPPDLLVGTAFEPLAEAPRAYAARDASGVLALIRVAKAAAARGDHGLALRQLRNAGLLALMVVGTLPPGLSERTRAACEAIEPGSLAGCIAGWAATELGGAAP